MGVCIGLTFDPELEEAKEAFGTDGKCIARALPELDEICLAAHVTKLSAFVDSGAYDLSEEEYESMPEEFRPEAEPDYEEEAEFRECSEIITAVAAVIKALESRSSGTESFSPEAADNILEDLRLMLKALEIGSQADAKCILFLW
jgi:hypothetical protein